MTHTLARSPILPMQEWWMLAAAVAKAISHINNRDPIIYGPFGSGPPIINDEQIRFNGNQLAHQFHRAHPSLVLVDAERFDAHEDFVLHRAAPTTLTTGWFFNTTVTRGKPYALAVRVTFLLARHYFPLDTLIIAAGSAEANDWNRALIYARATVPDILPPPECSPKPPRGRPPLAPRAPQFAVHV